MISFKQFLEQTQAQISASSKVDNTSLPGSNTSAKYAKMVQKTLRKAERADKKDVPEVVM